MVKAYITYTTDKQMEKALKNHKIETTFIADKKINIISPNTKTKINLEKKSLQNPIPRLPAKLDQANQQQKDD